MALGVIQPRPDPGQTAGIRPIPVQNGRISAGIWLFTDQERGRALDCLGCCVFFRWVCDAGFPVGRGAGFPVVGVGDVVVGGLMVSEGGLNRR
jgi:hypothetical protein